MGGTGGFEVSAKVGMRSSRRGVGVVEITLHPKSWRAAPTLNHVGLDGVGAVLDELGREGLLPMAIADNLYLSTDFLIVNQSSAFLVKPLANRLWRPSQAAQDARRLIRATDSQGPRG